jgi:hypothetical protein
LKRKSRKRKKQRQKKNKQQKEAELANKQKEEAKAKDQKNEGRSSSRRTNKTVVTTSQEKVVDAKADTAAKQADLTRERKCVERQASSNKASAEYF